MPAQAVKQGILEALEAAFALGESANVEQLLASIETIPPGSRPPYLDAQAKRFRARLDGDPSGYEAAEAAFRDLSLPFWLAVTLLEHGEWLAAQGRAEEAEPHLAEAREIFEGLKATPWLERADGLAGKLAEPVPTSG